MPKRRIRKQQPIVIEISDSSSSDENQVNNQKTATVKSTRQIPPDKNHDKHKVCAAGDEGYDDDDDESSARSSSPFRILTRRQHEEQLPVASRTKGANKGVASMRLISLDFVEGRREGLSQRSQENMTKLSRIESSKKKSYLKDDIHKAVSADDDDPELMRLLKKIAYCRVFTNYLFRQYDMLSIDFQLYSNLDNLMMDLRKRVGAYNAIRRSRKEILLGVGQRNETNSTSSREGSTV